MCTSVICRNLYTHMHLQHTGTSIHMYTSVTYRNIYTHVHICNTQKPLHTHTHKHTPSTKDLRTLPSATISAMPRPSRMLPCISHFEFCSRCHVLPTASVLADKVNLQPLCSTSTEHTFVIDRAHHTGCNFLLASCLEWDLHQGKPRAPHSTDECSTNTSSCLISGFLNTKHGA